MSKDPAFLLYPNDWLGGTMYMTFEEKGCYMELLMLQFNCGKFTEAQAKQVLSICFDVAWANIKHKFKFDGEFYMNERLEEEIQKRKKFTESRRNNGLSPKKKKKNENNLPEAYAKHMGNENENENNSNNVSQISIQIPESYPYQSDEFKKLFEQYIGIRKANNIYTVTTTQERLLIKLKDIAKTEKEAIEIVSRAIINNHKDFYKDDYSQKKKEPEKNYW